MVAEIIERTATALEAHSFDYRPGTRVVFGLGTVSRLGELAGELGVRRALLVSDRHLVAAGHVARATESLTQAGLDVTVFDRVQENPTTRDVGACVATARHGNIELIVGLGGGSSMDCAKGCNFILTNGGQMRDYRGVGKAHKPMLPMIAVPTTAGTGSEAQSFALISDERTHEKMACGDRKATCRVAILDPQLTVTMPRQVTAATGIDAIAHAVETAVTTRRTLLSRMYSTQAWQLLSGSFEAVLSDGENIEARGAMLLGANLAGTAIELSMLGATHACANPLTRHFGMTHGVAIGIMLPHVVRFNAESPDCDYSVLMGPGEPDAQAAGYALAGRIDQLLSRSGQQCKLSDCGVREAIIPVLAEEAAQQWTGNFNPRALDLEDFASLYRSAL